MSVGASAKMCLREEMRMRAFSAESYNCFAPAGIGVRSSDMDARKFAMDNFVDSVSNLEECNCADQQNLRVALSEQKFRPEIFSPDHVGIEGARCATFNRSCKENEAPARDDLTKAEDFALMNFVEAASNVEGCNCRGERNLRIALSEQRSDTSNLFSPDHLGLELAYCAVHGKACK
jgi:hypothetical protein